MNRSLVVQQAAWLVPIILILASFGRLVLQPSAVLVDASRPTIDHARVIAATPGNDLTRQFWPLHLYVARTWARTGHLPEWDDRGFGGRPLVGNPQAGLFYPPVWLAWLIPIPATLGWITIGHLIWASLGTGRLARTLRLGVVGQTVAAGCFVLSPYVLAQTFEGHYPHVWAAAWYPWAFQATIEVSGGRWRSGLAVAFCLAAVVLVGHPQEGYYLAVALASWTVITLVWRTFREGSRRWLLHAGAIWLGVALLTLGIVSVELIPDAMAQVWSLRSSRLPLRLASRYHPLAINALQAVNPFALGEPSSYFGPENYWETVLSIGLVPLVLAGVGVTWTRDRGKVWGWLILVVAAVVFAGGRKLGLFALMYEWVPGMDRFRVPSRSLFLASLGAAILAGFGVEALRAEAVVRPDRWNRLTNRWLLAVLLLVTTMGWGWWQTGGSRPEPHSNLMPRSVVTIRYQARARSDGDVLVHALRQIGAQPTCWLACLGLTIGLTLSKYWPGWRPGIAVGLGLLGLIELAGSGYQLLAISPPSAFLPGEPTETMVRAAGADRPSAAPLRIRADEAVMTDLAAVALGLNKTDINDTFQIQHAADLYERLYDLSRPRPVDLTRPMSGPVVEHGERIQQAVFDRMAVDLIIANQTSPRLLALIAKGGWPVVGVWPGGDRSILARNAAALPRAYVVPRAEVIAVDDSRSIARFVDSDPRQAVFMTFDPLAGIHPAPPRQEFRPVRWTSTDPDRAVLEVTTDGSGLLVIADTWMPGWTAWLDGRVVPVERGNHAQCVIALSRAGRHEVILHYQAPGFRLGLAITVGSLIVWSTLWLAGQRWERIERSRTVGAMTIT